MASDKKRTKIVKQEEELETFRTEYRTLVGRAIIGGLINPNPGGVGGRGGLGGELFLKAPDYDQDSGDYTQSGGGNHDQNSGNYNQSP